MKLRVNIKNTTKVLKKFDEFGYEGIEQFKAITKFKAQEIEYKAKTNAAINKIWDMGKLIQGIRNYPVNEKGLAYFIKATEPYSAYHEFGTGTKVEIPDGWGDIARQFKGKGIKEINIQARPFLYPAFKDGGKNYINDLNSALKKLTKKFNR